MKTKTATHTPTPITILHVKYGGVPRFCIDAAYDTLKEAEQHVRAVNAHEMLLEALRKAGAQVHLQHIGGRSHEAPDYFFEDCGHIHCEPIQQAIAKAEK